MLEIGKYKVKRPKFILFLDKDGTTDLEDKNLNSIFNLVSTMGGMIIFVTGRTVGDIEGELKRKGKKVPEIIVGDNGAVICYTKTGEFLEQKTLEHDKALKIVDNFIENGGNKDYIRYTNGKEVFASKEKEVKNYYRKNKMVNFCNDIYKSIQQTENITKIVLAGTEDLMQQVTKFSESMDCWVDRDVTAFPKKDCQNYRLDIAQRNINKGDAVRKCVEKLDPEYGFLCVGNGANDVSMFKVAIDFNMIVAMMGSTSTKVFQEVTQYAKEKKKGKVEKVPYDKNLANKYILKKAKVFQEHIVRKEKQMQKNTRLPNVPRVKVERIDRKNIRIGKRRQSKDLDR